MRMGTKESVAFCDSITIDATTLSKNENGNFEVSQEGMTGLLYSLLEAMSYDGATFNIKMHKN